MNNKSGATLIEAMVALAIAAIIGAAIIAIVLQAQAATTSARLKNQATRYGEALLNNIRGKDCPVLACDSAKGILRKGVYNDPNAQSAVCQCKTSPACTVTCQITPTAHNPPCLDADYATILDSNSNPTPFSLCYEICDSSLNTITECAGVGASVKKVTARVKYNDRGQTKTISLSTYLTDR